MKLITAFKLLCVTGLIVVSQSVFAKVSSDTMKSISTPDKVSSRIGELNFRDGAPSRETLDLVYDHLTFTHAFNTFVNTMQGVNMAAARQGFLDIGVQDNQILIFSELMDSNSLFLTANADTVYFLGFIDLANGPMVVETPPKSLGTIDDFWWRWVTDFGMPGPDRGEGGRYLILPPGYKGELPEGGYFISQAETFKVLILGRSFMENNDPKPTVQMIKNTAKIYPYKSGGYGTSIAQFLTGNVKLSKVESAPSTVFHEGSGKSFSTIPPNDFSFYELLHKVVQQEPATSLNPELYGSLEAIGIVKGKPFNPDQRTKKILMEALDVANATSRSLFMNPSNHPEWAYYPGSSWLNPLFISGYKFETPIPEITDEGVKPYPPTGYRTLDIRTMFFYGVTGITPAMSMRLEGIGSQYLLAMQDADKNYFDGSKTYKLRLPKGIPQEKFWSLTVYDNQTRSMLATEQRYPRAGSQSFPSPAAESDPDGSVTVYMGPEQPKGVSRGNWIQTSPGKGWFIILRLYSPLEPFFTKEWRPGEVELVK